MADDAPEYTFVASGDACDVCAAMQGTYPSPPPTPVHDNCRCIVIGPTDDCAKEVRNVQVSDDTYSAEWSMGEYQNCGAPATVARVTAHETFPSSADEGMEEYLLEDTPADSEPVDIPANTFGSIRAVVQLRSRWAVGELWQVCTSPDPVAGTNYQEVYLGDVGAASEVIDSIEPFVDAQPCG